MPANPRPEEIELLLSDPDTKRQALGRLLSTSVLPELYSFYKAEHQRVDSRDDSTRFADTAWANVELFGLFVAFLCMDCKSQAWPFITKAASLHVEETALRVLQIYSNQQGLSK